jgi:hypothetical protein
MVITGHVIASIVVVFSVNNLVIERISDADVLTISAYERLVKHILVFIPAEGYTCSLVQQVHLKIAGRQGTSRLLDPPLKSP